MPLPAGHAVPFQSTSFRTTARRAPNGVILTVCGELDLATAPHLEAALSAYLRCRPRTLTVDLSAVTFVDCSGLNALLRTRLRAGRGPTAMRLGPVSAPVTRLLALTGALPQLTATGML